MESLDNLFIRSLLDYSLMVLDQGLRGTTSRTLILADEVQNLLLDIRGSLADAVETLENWEDGVFDDRGCVAWFRTDSESGEVQGF